MAIPTKIALLSTCAKKPYIRLYIDGWILKCCFSDRDDSEIAPIGVIFDRIGIFCAYFTINQRVYQCEYSAVLTWTERRFRPCRDFSRCATHQRTLRHRFSGACQLRCKQITQFRIVMSAEHTKFCACVKPTCFYHFREGSHTRANFHMRSMGIYRRFFFEQSAMMPFSVLRG